MPSIAHTNPGHSCMACHPELIPASPLAEENMPRDSDSEFGWADSLLAVIAEPEIDTWQCANCGCPADDCHPHYRYDDWCEDCGSSCENCGATCCVDDMASVNTGRHRPEQQMWCEHCVSRRTFECGHCNETIDNYREQYCNCGSVCSRCLDDTYYCDECDERFCNSDHMDECESSSYRDNGHHLYDYSYKPRTNFRGEGNSFLGMELEVGLPTEFAGEIHNRHGDLLYCKKDGSVNGFEMVTHPMTYEWAMTEFPWALLEEMKSHGSAGPNGLHVHISRAGFKDEAHQAAWLLFTYSNQRGFEAMARRDPSEWGRFIRPQYAIDRIFNSNGDYPPRYEAINVQNRDTLEMRIFASSLDIQSVQAALGLVTASAEYVGLNYGWTNDDSNPLDWAEFAGWVFSQGERFAPLAAEMHSLTSHLIGG